MRQFLKSTTALGLGSIGLLPLGLAGPATASDGIKLTVGGFFNTAYQVNFDDNGKNDLGHDANIDGVFSSAEIWFDGETTLDNGLTVGAHVELEGETASDQIDEAYAYFSGGFGTVRLGSFDDALEEMCVTPPGATANFGAFSPDMIAANIAGAGLTSNTVCTGLTGDAQKIAYFTPEFSGFQFFVTYAPNANAEGQSNGGPHVGMPSENPGDAGHVVSAYATYNYAGEGWGLTAGGGAVVDGHVEHGADALSEAGAAYQGDLNLTFGNFSIGGAIEYWHDFGIVDGVSLTRAQNARTWIAGGGMAYVIEPVTIGLQYSYGLSEIADADDGGTGNDVNQQRVALTGIYNLGPGIDFDAEVAYTWLNSEAPDSDAVDRYDSLEFGIGTSFSF
jgi:outer membrane protein OmpU